MAVRQRRLFVNTCYAVELNAEPLVHAKQINIIHLTKKTETLSMVPSNK